MHQIYQTALSLPQLAEIADINIDTLKSYIQGGLIPDIEAVGRGKVRQYSFENLMQVFVAKVMMDKGMGKAAAFHCATAFAYVGEGPSGWSGDLNNPQRGIGMPYHHRHGETWLLFDGDTTVIQIGTNPPFSGEALGYLAVNCSRAFEIVCLHLGHHPLEVLDQVEAGQVEG